MAQIDRVNMKIEPGARDWLRIGVNVDEAKARGLLRETLSITKLLRCRIAVEVVSVLPQSHLFSGIPEDDQRSQDMGTWKHVEEISGLAIRPRETAAYIGRRAGSRIDGGAVVEVQASTSISRSRPHSPIEAGKCAASLS